MNFIDTAHVALVPRVEKFVSSQPQYSILYRVPGDAGASGIELDEQALADIDAAAADVVVR
jgi:hypothetical protein